MSMEHWWNDTDRGKPKYTEKKKVYSSAIFSNINPTRTGLVSNLCLQTDRVTAQQIFTFDNAAMKTYKHLFQVI